MILIDSKHGRCDARCYDAKNEKCDCICGGKNHMKGLKESLKQTKDVADNIPEVVKVEV